MLGDFYYVNPTKLYFGENSLQYLQEELQRYGNKIMLVYGGGSIKRTESMIRLCRFFVQMEKSNRRWRCHAESYGAKAV